ncbi:hypothetical protein PUN28_012006 [Cardiocondyla obscurior]|uniref:Uncharacterized protein n=1 Tax=Cardiocondyla obscurior TaxID=286306 RepID=A0AAW2FDT3_9HYME
MKDDPISGKQRAREGEEGPSKRYTYVLTHTRWRAHARTRVRVNVERSLRNACTPAFANTRRLRAWRTKAPGKRKDVVEKTTGERAGDAARLSSHRRYYTRYDGKLALTVLFLIPTRPLVG